MAGKENLAQNAVTVALAVLALLSVVSIVATTTRSAEWVGTVLNLQIGVSDVRLRTKDSPQVLVTFNLQNGSPASVELETFDVYLYVGRRFVGTNYVPFTGMRMEGHEETIVEIVVPISSPHRAFVEQARQNEDFSWYVYGRAKALFPTFHQKTMWLHVREYWTGE